MAKIYGNLTNRFEEGKNYTGREINVGDDITMYYWSDRTCYYVTDVINQKRIKVKPYHVCADKEKATGMGHQEWKYFKTMREKCEYLGIIQDNIEYDSFEREETWVFRYGKWMRECTFTEDYCFCSERELKSLQKKGYYNRYFDLSGKVSFGVRDYYYDWEF